MQQIADWLEKLGMSEYAQRFAENGIDLSVLPDLTDQDFKEMGVLLGHRRKLLRAIAELNETPAAAASAPTPLPPPPIAAAAGAPSAQAVGERRYLTVMFCDLVGSTGIAAQLDAEEWRDLVGAYLDAASAAVTEMGGHVAKKLGDGLMALFGYPAAQENDAERAARAALAIQRALAELNRKNSGSGKPVLAARIGLETGPAVVDAAGEIYGDVANVAARVQALAEPGAVLVTARVQRQVAGLFVAEERGTHTLKGVPKPTALFRLVRASGGGRRSGARNLTPLIGRDDETAMLTRRWERARQGDGQLVMIVGEPGLGKSRLIEEFHARLRDTPHTWVEWSCSQLLQNTPLHPIAEWGRQRFGGNDVPAERRLAELESSLMQVKLEPAENVPLLAPLLDIPLPQDRVSTLAPEELRRRQLAALTNWSIASARVQPVVLAFEDLHWADPTTLDVLRSIAERGALAPLFILATTRPEFRPAWSMRSHHGTISLAPLDRAQVSDMVAELSARHALPKEVVDDVAARTGGVPLFVEEVTRLLLERGEHGGIQAIPPTLQQSLAARLDRLGPAREVAQIGSVIGRGFSYGLLREAAGLEDGPLQAALEKLAEADILLVQGVPPESDYRFKHALIQDAAYENLLKSRRQVLHRRVAEILRDSFGATAAAEPEALAHHFTQACMTDAAIEWWGKAGDQALRRSAFQEAISHLGKAIEMADKAGEGTPRPTVPTAPARRLKLQTSYGQAMLWGKGYAAPETAAVFARARELASGDATERFDTYYGQWAGSYMRGEYALARETAAAFVRDAENGARTPEAAAAHRVLGLTCLSQGDLIEARAHLEKALRICDPQWDRDTKFRFGHDTGVSATAYLARTNWLLGEFGYTRELNEDAVARAVETAHIQTLTNTHLFKAQFGMLCGDADAARRDAETVIRLSRAHELPTYLALGIMSRGWTRARLGERKAGMAELRDGLTTFTEQGNKTFVPFYQGLLAELEDEAEGAKEAGIRIDEALALSQQTGEHWSDAFLHRIRGEILLKRDPTNTAPAEDAFLTAIAIAQRQKARSFELRATLSLAKLYRSIDRNADAHAVLAPALEGFSPTPELPEVEEAQSLLAALAETDEVKNGAASRQRRLKLQTSYGLALAWSRGFVSEEAKAAFTRAQELSTGGGISDERFTALYGRWVNNIIGGELGQARNIAEIFLREAESAARMPEKLAALRYLGLTLLWQGHLAEALPYLEEVLRTYDPNRDREAQFRFGTDSLASATIYLAHAYWQLGDVKRARELSDEAIARAAESAHGATLANTWSFKAALELYRGDAEATRHAAEAVIDLSREYGLPQYLARGVASLAWARAQLGDEQGGVTELRQALAALTEQGVKFGLPFLQGLLAETEARVESAEGAFTRIDEALALANETGEHQSDAFLHRIRGEILLKRDPANTTPAEDAFLVAIAIAQQQKARSFELCAALSLAKLYQSTGRDAEANAVLAPALEGFSPTPEFPEIEVAQALLSTLTETDEVKNAAASRQRRLKLQTSYGLAMAWSRGFAAKETKAAFTRAQELSPGADNSDERFTTLYGQWLNSIIGGELGQARTISETFLREAKNRSRMPETMAGLRYLGLVLLKQGHFEEARTHFEEVLRTYDPGRDREAQFRFGTDSLASATIYLAQACWPLGDFKRARELSDDAIARAVESAHRPTLANVWSFKAALEMYRGDAQAALHASETLADLCREHGPASYRALAAAGSGWARARLGDEEAGLAELRQALVALTEQGFKFALPYFQGSLAEIEAKVGSVEGALIRIDEALALANAAGEHQNEGFLHRVRGEILFKRDPANTAPAEEAFLAAVAVARQQKARSLELRAALSLAKLYQSTGRAADAHAVLAPALEGFSPTLEFPEIEEAQTLLAALAQSDDVKDAATSRLRRLKLQNAYGLAVAWSRGFAAEETKAAFTRAQELSPGADNSDERFTTLYGQWVNSIIGGELELARKIAETFLREAKSRSRMPETMAALRYLGLVLLSQGHLVEARTHLEEVLRTYDPGRDREAQFRFGTDSLASATIYLAQADWLLGDFSRARELGDEAIARAVDSAHGATLANTWSFKAGLEMYRGDAEATMQAAKALADLSREHGLASYLAHAAAFSGWARARLGDEEAGLTEFRQALAALTQLGNKFGGPLYQALLAEIEARVESAEGALIRIDEGLALANETGEHRYDSLLHRIRGDILLKGDPANTAAAEESFLTAVAIAQQQKARTVQLHAALALAKLYQSTARAADAHAVLGPALEGFSPTPDLPEIAEAQALLVSLLP